MNLKSVLINFAEKLTGLYIYRSPPRGLVLSRDIKYVFPNYSMDVVFDVGANRGQSAEEFAKVYLNSEIYSFEPVEDTFKQLQENMMKYHRFHAIKIALGSAVSEGKMILQKNSKINYLAGQSKNNSLKSGAPSENVHVNTVDNYCFENNIKHIGLLKIDTEGGDMDVLKGALKMIDEHKVDFIQVEAGMNPNNTWHVPFEEFKIFFENREYYLFGLYEQTHERSLKKPHLRRTNSVFVANKLIQDTTFKK